MHGFAPTPGRAPLPGSALVRSLARLAELSAPDRPDSLAEVLGRWLAWTDAIALSTALDGRPPAPDGVTAPSPAARLIDDAARLRRRLDALVRPPAPGAPADLDALQAHATRVQQTLRRETHALRERVRAALAAGAPAHARLAAIDAVLAEVVAERERAVLDGLPRWLERRAAQRRRQSPTLDSVTLHAGLAHELADALQALLEHTWQPLAGLLAALGPFSPRTP